MSTFFGNTSAQASQTCCDNDLSGIKLPRHQLPSINLQKNLVKHNPVVISIGSSLYGRVLESTTVDHVRELSEFSTYGSLPRVLSQHVCEACGQTIPSTKDISGPSRKK